VYRVGMDLGGTNISVGVVSSNWAIIGSGRRPSLALRAADEILSDMAAAVRDAVVDAGLFMADVESIGIGTPSGSFGFANNLSFHHVPARAVFTNRSRWPDYMNNDANCAALDELLGKSVLTLHSLQPPGFFCDAYAWGWPVAEPAFDCDPFDYYPPVSILSNQWPYREIKTIKAKRAFHDNENSATFSGRRYPLRC